jgi:AraC family transcriptional regulator, melibiose operon regulatory protein
MRGQAMATSKTKPAANVSDNASERRFYARSKAFGRLGMRIFKPQIMAEPHWHGHIEINFIRNAKLFYLVDGTPITVEPDQLIVFWANVPHQLVDIVPTSTEPPELCNIYLPLDTFLMMPHLPNFQITLINGAMIACPKELCGHAQLLRWYEDYRSNNSERLDIMKSEINALFRRIALQDAAYLRAPWLTKQAPSNLSSSHIRHVVAMVRYVFDNLGQPLNNTIVSSVTGLHPNYALSVFSQVMNLPLKQFILRMRLLRARGLLLESDVAITTIAVQSGFGSTSQFYAHFSAAYGISPNQLRERYLGK